MGEDRSEGTDEKKKTVSFLSMCLPVSANDGRKQLILVKRQADREYFAKRGIYASLPLLASSSSGCRHTYAHAQRTHTYADTMTERGDDMETNYAV